MRSETYSLNITGSPSYYDIWKAVRKQTVRKIVDWDEDKLEEYLNTLFERDEDLPEAMERVSEMGIWIWNRMRNQNFNMGNHVQHHIVNGRLICDDISEYKIASCYNCSHLSYSDDQQYVYGGDYACAPCITNYYFEDDNGDYIHEDDREDEDDEYHEDSYGKYNYDACVINAMRNMGYVSKWINGGMRMPSDDKDEMLLGLEAEWEIRDEDDMYDLVEDMHTQMRGFAIVKHDGSLDNGGEIVTIPATLKSQKYRWTQFCESKTNFTNRCKAWHTSTCGTHIHVDRRAVTPLEIGKLLLFVNGNHNSSFITAFAGRGITQWCKRYAKNIKDGLERTDKYESINTGKPNTIEFRMFRGNLSKSGIMRNLEFVHSLVRFVKQSPYDIDTDSLIDLRYENFVKWVGLQDNRGMYPYLYKWLVKNSFTGRGKTNTIRENEVNECA
tara:strand:- start:2044 stop:3369 length:1326 start_codon:yes stop_codon:yes gene_type:complete